MCNSRQRAHACHCVKVKLAKNVVCAMPNSKNPIAQTPGMQSSKAASCMLKGVSDSYLIFFNLSKSSRSLVSSAEDVSWLKRPSLWSFCLFRNQSGILNVRGFDTMTISSSSSLALSSPALPAHQNPVNHKVATAVAVTSRQASLALNIESLAHLLPRSTSAFLQTMLENRRPIPLMDVMAYMIFCLPSTLVLRTRRICWKLSVATKDCTTHTKQVIRSSTEQQSCAGVSLQHVPPCFPRRLLLTCFGTTQSVTAKRDKPAVHSVTMSDARSLLDKPYQPVP